MTPRLALIALLTLPLAACEGTGLPGLGTQTETQPEGHKGPPTVSPLQQPIETGAAAPRAIATAESRTLNTTAFTARGNEPFWRVDAAGNTAIYRTAENQNGRAVRVSRLTFAQGVEYIGTLNGRPFVLNVRGRDCQDSMSGERFPMSASLTVSGRTTAGCAGPASAEVATAVAATRAPAPAEPRARPAATRPAAARPAPAPAAPEATEETPATTTPAAETPAVTPSPTPAPAPAPAAETPAPATNAAPVTETAPATPAPAPAAAPAAGTTDAAPATPPVIPPASTTPVEPEEEAPATE